jgi:ABC-2 type transport system permease protein
MISARSLFDRGLWRQSIRQHGWLGIIYLVGLLFAMPLQLVLNERQFPFALDNLFHYPADFQSFFFLTVPIATGIFVFRFVQVKASSDLWHSLPIRREGLFISHYVCGLLLLIVPVWIAAGVTALIRPVVASSFFYSWADVWSWGWIVSVITIFMYSFAVFVGICVGHSILQTAVTYIMLFFPTFIILLTNFHFETYLYGFSEYSWGGGRAEDWSPFLRLVEFRESLTGKEQAVYFILAVLFAGAAFALYRRRKAERANQTIAFTFFKPVFQLGMTFCAMLITGTYFYEMKHQLGWTIFGYTLGAVLGFVGSEMIIRKTWYIVSRKAVVLMTVYSSVLGLLLFASGTNVTGFESRVPDAASIREAYFGSQLYRMELIKEYQLSDDVDYIEAVRQLHKRIVEFGPAAGSIRELNRNEPVQSIGIVYILSNGRTMVRDYMMPKRLISGELKKVMESLEYKEIAYGLSRLDQQIDRIHLRGWHSQNKQLELTSPEEIREFTSLLKQEVSAMSYEEITDDFQWAYIEVMYRQSKSDPFGYSFTWKKSYKQMEDWLVRKGYADRLKLIPDDIDLIRVIKLTELGDVEYYQLTETHFRMLAEKNAAVDIEEKRLMPEILLKLRSHRSGSDGYLVILKQLDADVLYFNLRQEDLTPNLAERIM